MKFYEVTLEENPNDNTYSCLPNEGGLWADADDLLQEIRSHAGDIFELGVDELPDSLEDIRGLIHSEPERVFTFSDEHGQYFFGIEAK